MMTFFEDVLKRMDDGKDSGDFCAYARSIVKLGRDIPVQRLGAAPPVYKHHPITQPVWGPSRP